MFLTPSSEPGVGPSLYQSHPLFSAVLNHTNPFCILCPKLHWLVLRFHGIWRVKVFMLTDMHMGNLGCQAYRVIPPREGMQALGSTQKAEADALSSLRTFVLSVWTEIFQHWILPQIPIMNLVFLLNLYNLSLLALQRDLT